MTPQEREAIEKYVQPGKTLVRYEDTWNGESIEYLGIVMETYPYTNEDKDTYGHYRADMLMVAWFDGTANPFPLCCLDFWVKDQWLASDDLMMGEAS